MDITSGEFSSVTSSTCSSIQQVSHKEHSCFKETSLSEQATNRKLLINKTVKNQIFFIALEEI